MLKFKFTRLIFSAALVWLTGCTTVGLGNVPKTRENYNLALNQSDNEQFLLNLIRMHFDKSPYFVGVDSITTQTTLKLASGSDDTTLSNATNGRSFPPLGAFWNFQPNIEFIQSPTITYSPLQGTSYISGLLTAIDTTKLYYLVQANLSLAAVLKLTTDQIGPLYNSREAWRNDKLNTLNHWEFNRFVDDVDQLRLAGKLGLYMGSYKQNKVLVMVLKDKVAAARVSKALNLDKTYTKIILSRHENQDNNKNVVKFQTRSFFAALNFLSKGIIASPTDDAQYGINSQINLDNQLASASQLTDGLFRMYSSESAPSNALNKVAYEGKWYYIKNNDIISKATLIIVKLMYSLQAGEVTDSTWSSLDILDDDDDDE